MPKTRPPDVDLDTSYSLTEDQIASFREGGFVKLKNVLSAATLDYYRDAIAREVERLRVEMPPMEKRDTYSKAFVQAMNLWRNEDEIQEFVFSRRLAEIATRLLGTRGVRLYHDQALFKDPSGGFTPWHVDQYYWPLSNTNTVTAWIPLHAVPMERGPLEFSIGSQNIKFGRDLSIGDESEKQIGENLKRQNLPVDSSPYDLGEVSFHYGYTFHRAGPNTSEFPREVMTIIYMDSEMKVTEPKNKNQQADLDTWMPGCRPGEVAASPLNPVLYEA